MTKLQHIQARFPHNYPSLSHPFILAPVDRLGIPL